MTCCSQNRPVTKLKLQDMGVLWWEDVAAGERGGIVCSAHNDLKLDYLLSYRTLPSFKIHSPPLLPPFFRLHRKSGWMARS